MTLDKPLRPSDQGDQDLSNRLMDEVNRARQESDRQDRATGDITAVTDIRTEVQKVQAAKSLMEIFNRNEEVAKQFAKNIQNDDILRKQLYS